MPKDLALLLRETLARELPNLRAVPADRAAQPPLPGKWSPKEELGHLIDSATNNHVRFVIASIDGEFRGAGYTQDEWVRVHAYGDVAWNELVDVWFHYNSLLAHLVQNIPETHLTNKCMIGANEFTLGFVMADYVRHMQHHLDHILGR